MKSKSIIPIFLLIALLINARTSKAAIISAASCSQTDLQTAFSATEDAGSVPFSGNCSWNSTLEICPDRGGSANMIFTSLGANADYPYTPYTYPHPLTLTADTTPPAASTGLVVN